MHSVGIDIGKRQHVAAICRQGQRKADKPVLRFSSDRSGLLELEQWLGRHGPVDRVVMESSGHYWSRSPRRSIARPSQSRSSTR